ncbi:MAG: 2-oxoacid:acceptor oxidoreductase family protein [Spirochaetaceae bacterium]|jgi:2-oxoglutarate ferredoxin oxidoreductase subunit gamma|nr:2-oxoacid:acceptor oxidoreductase family protein [Spirochaetaceae bacterium]
MKNKTEKSFFAGFGGQGIVLLGQLWASCAVKQGKKATFFPFYGAEKRGGVARANVIVSDGDIASPLVEQADSAVVMNEESLPLCEKMLKQGGLLLVNSALVKREPSRSDIRVFKINACEIAERIGNIRFANRVVFGALAKLTGALSLKKIDAAVRAFFPREKERHVPLNIKAIEAGFTAI